MDIQMQYESSSDSDGDTFVLEQPREFGNEIQNMEELNDGQARTALQALQISTNSVKQGGTMANSRQQRRQNLEAGKQMVS